MNICKIKGCDKKVKGYGYCNKHYVRYKRYGDPLFTKRKTDGPPVKCKVVDCDRDSKGRGYCLKHYKRFMKYGDASHKEVEFHGKTNNSEYYTWSGMKDRCYNRDNKGYKYYGGRGIRVCDRWRNSFLAFYEDMGLKPFPEAQIDRIDNDGNYEPCNCRWVSKIENLRNQSITKLTMEKAREIRHKHKTENISIKKLALMYNVCYSTIHYIIKNKNWKEGIK